VYFLLEFREQNNVREETVRVKPVTRRDNINFIWRMRLKKLTVKMWKNAMMEFFSYRGVSMSNSTAS